MRLNLLLNHHGLGAAFLVLAAATLPAKADYQATVLGQGPVGYWRLDETTQPPVGPIFATNIGSVGVAGNGSYIVANRGVKPGAIASETGNGAVGFDGVTISNRVRIPFQTQWNPAGPLSVEFWAKPSQTDNLACPAASVEFIGQPPPAPQIPPEQRNGWLFYQGNSDLSDGQGWLFREYDSAGLTNLTSTGVDMSLDTNQWYHVVGVFDGTHISIYINGILGATTPFPNAPRANTNSSIPLTFGNRADGASGYFPYSGLIDEAAVYDVALSPAQILAHYQAGTNTAPATPYSQVIQADGPAGYWRFNEPADPPAANLGTLGSAVNGSYAYNAAPGAAGPSPPLYPGFQSGNTGVAFDGVGGGYVSVPGLTLNTNTVTFTGWINASGSQAAQAGVILNHSDTTAAGITIDVGGGLALSYNWNNDPATFNWFSGVSAGDSDWTYVALVIQPTQAALYAVFGTDFTTWTAATNFVTHASQTLEGPTLFGADISGTNLLFKGTIDEVAIFNRALSEGELYTEYGSAVGTVAPQIFADVATPAAQPFVGETLNLAVDAGGTPLLSYQWRKNGSGVSGAISNAFTIANLLASDGGSYDVVVTNSYGSVTSSVAVISVQTQTMPVVSQGPTGRTLYPGGFLDLTVQASGGQLHYQWQKGGTNVTGATGSAYVVNSVVGSDGGVYRVSISNSVGIALGGPATVNVIVPATNTYEATIVGDTPEAWWRLDEPAGSTTMLDAMGRHDGTYVGTGITLGSAGAVANGAPDTAASFDGSESFGDVPYSSDLNSSDFTIEAWALLADNTVPRAPVSTYDTSAFKGLFFQANPNGTWEVDVGEHDQYIYYYTPLGNIIPGRWAHLAATSKAGQPSYYVDGKEIPPPPGYLYPNFVHNTKFDFLIGGVGTNWQAANIARWKGTIDEVAVYKHALTGAQIQNHYIQALYGINTKPTFVTQPVSAQLALGDPESFSPQVEGSIPLTYQWFKNGMAVPNATNASLSFVKIAFSDTGNYQLVAINPAGTNSSDMVTLTVVPAVMFANATNALVLHLRFDGDLTDASGRGNNGTPKGAPSFVPGQIGQALHYDTETQTNGPGGNVTNADYVSLGRPQDLLFGASTSFSVAFWVRLPSGSTGGDLPFFGSAIGSANNQGFTFCPKYGKGGWQWDLDQVTTAVTNNVDVNGPDSSINDGQWHHFAATFDRDSTIALTYLDGLQVNSVSIASVGVFDSTNTISIGQDPTGLYSEAGSADLDDLGVWRRVLAPFEVYAIYYSGAHFGAALDAYGPVSLAVTTSGTNPVVLWQAGTLLQADTPGGPWTPVSGATPPTYTVTPGSATKFYRVHL